jgi:hypothetical protein
MIKFAIQPFLNSEEFSLDLEDFEPKGGYELFLKDACAFLDAKYLDWHQGIETGIGHINYKGYKVTVFWTDFPFALSFDCRDEAMALDLRDQLQAYFSAQSEK